MAEQRVSKGDGAGMNATEFQAKTRHVLSEVLFERRKQDDRWGEQNHNPVEWVSVEAEEFGEAAMEANKAYWTTNGTDKRMHLTLLREELVQVAAVAVAAIESLDRNELRFEAFEVGL